MFGISQPLKDQIGDSFRRADLRIDSLDSEFLTALYNRTNFRSFSTTKINEAHRILSKIGREVNITEKDIIEILRIRLTRNIYQHEQISTYVQVCKKSQKTPLFLDLLRQANLNGLLSYKPQQLKILEKLFAFYVNDDRYR